MKPPAHPRSSARGAPPAPGPQPPPVCGGGGGCVACWGWDFQSLAPALMEQGWSGLTRAWPLMAWTGSVSLGSYAKLWCAQTAPVPLRGGVGAMVQGLVWLSRPWLLAPVVQGWSPSPALPIPCRRYVSRKCRDTSPPLRDRDNTGGGGEAGIPITLTPSLGLGSPHDGCTDTP